MEWISLSPSLFPHLPIYVYMEYMYIYICVIHCNDLQAAVQLIQQWLLESEKSKYLGVAQVYEAVCLSSSSVYARIQKKWSPDIIKLTTKNCHHNDNYG